MYEKHSSVSVIRLFVTILEEWTVVKLFVRARNLISHVDSIFVHFRGTPGGFVLVDVGTGFIGVPIVGEGEDTARS